MNPKVIKIDLEHINAITALYKFDPADASSTDAARLETNKIRAQINAKELAVNEKASTFCDWVAEHKGSIEEPFKSMKCTDKDAISLYDFAAPGMYTGDKNKNETLWYIYAHGERNEASGGQIFARNQHFKYENDDTKKNYRKNNIGMEYGPDVCSHKYLKWVRQLQMTLAILAILYFLLHIVHLGVYSTSQSQGAKSAAELSLLVMSVITYLFLIVAYVIEQRSPIFTECSWITEWFRDDYVMLYRILLSYVILGSLGLVIVIVHISVMLTGKGEEADYALLNLVGSTKPNAFQFSA
jgi:hypothetical protein